MTELDIQAHMANTLCNMLSARLGRVKGGEVYQTPDEIRADVREIAIRELSEAQKEPK